MSFPFPSRDPVRFGVRVSHSSINGFDVAVAAGMVKGMMEHRFPVVLGKDFAGTVETVGEGVTSVKEGDGVFGVLMRDYVGDGTFAEFVVVPEAIGLAKIPSGLDPAIAGALGLAGTAAHAAMEAVSRSLGETVLISGATGGVGSHAIQLAVNRGAKVIATAKPGKDDFVSGLGAQHSVDYTSGMAEQVRSVRSEGVHAVIHLAGDASELIKLVYRRGPVRVIAGCGTGAAAPQERAGSWRTCR